VESCTGSADAVHLNQSAPHRKSLQTPKLRPQGCCFNHVSRS
jgi:hypothetical protein